MESSSIPDEVPVLTLGEVAPLAATQSFRPKDSGPDVFTEIDLADVDKQTGEVSSARVRRGAEFKGSKTPFDEGDLLFARIRPSLNNVVVAQRPHPDLPSTLAGSSEWIRLTPEQESHFALVAARSSFVRDQLQGTGGQTRPRIKADDLPGLLVPDPGAANRATIDRVVERAMRVRLAARKELDAIAAMYESFGRGELTESELETALAQFSES